jgi:hypothetical protein
LPLAIALGTISGSHPKNLPQPQQRSIIAEHFMITSVGNKLVIHISRITTLFSMIVNIQ